MKRKTPVNVSASVRARLLKVSKERREDSTLTLMNCAAEVPVSPLPINVPIAVRPEGRDAVRGSIEESYLPTRDVDLLSMGEATETTIDTAVHKIAATKVDDDGLVFDVGTLDVRSIREDNRYGGPHPHPH